MRHQQDLALLPGDLIACGTSVGVGVMKEPVNTVAIGIGELTNEFRQVTAAPRIAELRVQLAFVMPVDLR